MEIPFSENDGHVRIVVGDLGAGVLEQPDQLDRRRLARVGDVRLVRDAEDEDLRAGERALARVVQRLGDDRPAEVRHRLVDLPGELDELRVEAELARLPREVEGVDRDAVAAEPGAGLEGHEAERLRRRCLDDLPHVDVHPVAELCELVDERDVDRAEDVLEELRELGGLRATRPCARCRSRPRRALRRPRSTPRRSRRRPSVTFFVVQSSRPGSTRSGENARWKSLPAVRPLPRSRIGCTCSRVVPGYVVDSRTTRCPARKPGRDLLGGRDEDAQVGLALARERRREGDEDGVDVPQLVVVRRRGDEPGVDERLQYLRRHVLDVALALVQLGDAGRVDVHEQHALAGVGERAREREADVAGSDDGDVALHRLGIVATSTCAIRSEACPSPYSTGRFGRHRRRRDRVRRAPPGRRRRARSRPRRPCPPTPSTAGR